MGLPWPSVTPSGSQMVSLVPSGSLKPLVPARKGEPARGEASAFRRSPCREVGAPCHRQAKETHGEFQPMSLGLCGSLHTVGELSRRRVLGAWQSLLAHGGFRPQDNLLHASWVAVS